LGDQRLPFSLRCRTGSRVHARTGVALCEAAIANHIEGTFGKNVYRVGAVAGESVVGEICVQQVVYLATLDVIFDSHAPGRRFAAGRRDSLYWRPWRALFPKRGERSTVMAEEQEKRSFWRRLFSVNTRSAREEKVVGYFMHRIAEGASLREVAQEEYVRRNASPAEVEEILQNPKLLESAHEHMREDFESGELDPRRRPE
jgi:hypothetical protein